MIQNEEADCEVSLQREELEKQLLKQKTLAYCQETFPAIVKLHLARRTSAVVIIYGIKFRYHVSEPHDGEVAFTVESSPWALALEKNEPALWGLGKHIAAEAILAVRNGYKEYVRVGKRKREKEQLDKADTP